MHQMTEKQLEFWRDLTAPFPRDSYSTRSGGKAGTFTYLNPRVVQNRLDDVCGPDGWDTIATEGTRGMTCNLVLKTPSASGGITIISRSGCAGPRAMDDQSDNYKAEFSDAFKIAAASFGIGRDLYDNGMPAYCADLHNANASGTPQGASSASVGPAPRQQAQAPPSSPQPSTQSQEGPGKPPFGKAGTKAPYAWAMGVGTYYQTKVLDKMIDYAKARKKPERTDQWDEAFLNECLTKTVEWIKTLPNYGNEYGAPVPAPPTSQQAAAAPATPDLAPLKRTILASATALLNKRFGRDATQAEVIACIGEISADVANGNGRLGEVMESLKNCTDKKWLDNIKVKSEQLIREAAQQAAVDMPDDIPF